jgi:parallel beta-helix repeat protein
VRVSALLIGASSVPLLALFSLITVFQQIVDAQSATIIQVPSTQPTIQDAINVATNGDTVLVSPGIYTENIDFLGKAITVTSVSGSGVTIIDGNQLDPVVKFVSSEQRTSVLSGFTIRNGKDQNFGGGIYISYSSPTISGNLVINNQAESGSGIFSTFGSPLIQSNVISGNFDISFICCGGGGGIYLGGNGSAEIIANTIVNNTSSGQGAGIYLNAAGTPIISNNIISGNTTPSHDGGGIALLNVSNAEIVQNLIIGNTASDGGGVSWLVPYNSRGPRLINNTIVGNNSSSQILADGFDAQSELINNIVVGNSGQTVVFCGNLNDANPPIFRFNNIYSPSGTTYGGICADQTGTNGNVSVDPLFSNPADADYELQLNSPVIDVADTNNCPATDLRGMPRPQGGACDMGVYEVAQLYLPLILK